MRSLERYPLEDMASRVGTPFYFYDGDFLRVEGALDTAPVVSNFGIRRGVPPRQHGEELPRDRLARVVRVAAQEHAWVDRRGQVL